MSPLEDSQLPAHETELNGMPWQVKAIGLVGVPSVIALLLVWAVIGAFSAEAAANTKAVNEATQLIREHSTASKTDAEFAREMMRESIRLQRATCENTAKNDFDRANCRSGR